jgi:hypothetical protein
MVFPYSNVSMTPIRCTKRCPQAQNVEKVVEGALKIPKFFLRNLFRSSYLLNRKSLIKTLKNRSSPREF